MSFHLLSLNTSKTKFLLTGLVEQLSKISKSCSSCVSSDTTISSIHAARHLGYIFDYAMSKPDHISASANRFSLIYDIEGNRS
jgi:hypothetical protein